MKKKLLICLSAITMLGGQGIPSFAKAETLSEVQNNQSEVEKEILNTEQELSQIFAGQTELKEQINRLNHAIDANQQKYDSIKEKINAERSSLAEMETEIRKLEESIRIRNQILKNRIMQLQDLEGKNWIIEAIMGATSLSDLLNRVEAILTITNSDKTILNEQNQDKMKIETKQEEIQHQIYNLNRIKAEQEEILQIIEEQKKQKNEILSYLEYKKQQKMSDLNKLDGKYRQLAAQAIVSNITYTSSTLVPEEFMPYYREAEQKYNIPWHILAAIHFVETSFSANSNMVSSAGAVGHMQFMPETFKVYGVDGNNDGEKDPFNIEDAIESAANFLYKHGFQNNPKQALWHYNHADWYVNKVWNLSEKYRLSTMSNIPEVVRVGTKLIGNSTYVFGGGRTQEDIRKGIFDCSSFVHWAFSQVGIDLGPLTSTSTETLKNIGQQVPYSELQPGDLVFFDTYKKDGHVGIYVGEGKFIGAQSSTGVAVEDMSKGYWKNQFNGRVIRIR